MRALSATVLVLAACARPAPVSSDAGAAAPSPAATAPEWTPERLAAFLGLQRELLALAAPKVLADGGLGRRARLNDAAFARHEEAARKRSGLSDAQIAKVNALIGALAARHALAALGGDQGLLEQLSQARAELPDGSVPDELEGALRALEARRARAAAMTEERALYGDALVDLAVARQDELIGNWRQLLRLPMQGDEP